LDADGGRQAANEIDVRLRQLAQELTCVARQGLHIASLALGVQGVKSEGRLPRSADASKDDEGIAWQSEVYVPEVVFSSAANDNVSVVHHERPQTVGSVSEFSNEHEDCNVSRTAGRESDWRCRVAGLPPAASSGEPVK
jgi:hypothetical protein